MYPDYGGSWANLNLLKATELYRYTSISLCVNIESIFYKAFTEMKTRLKWEEPNEIYNSISTKDNNTEYPVIKMSFELERSEKATQ